MREGRRPERVGPQEDVHAGDAENQRQGEEPGSQLVSIITLRNRRISQLADYHELQLNCTLAVGAKKKKAKQDFDDENEPTTRTRGADARSLLWTVNARRCRR